MYDPTGIKKECINEYLNLISEILININKITGLKIMNDLKELTTTKQENEIQEALQKDILNDEIDITEINDILEYYNINIYEKINEYEETELTITKNNKIVCYYLLTPYTANEIGLNTIQI